MIRLKEGKEYGFRVEKELSLPDNSVHLVLKGPDQKKYLLPLFRYAHYQIIIGSDIICRVDRINCRGEVFLEPRNPWYIEGKAYPFIVDSIEKRTDNTGIKHDVIVVLDNSGNKINVVSNHSDSLPEKGSLLNLIIERITKGKIFLIKPWPKLNDVNLKVGPSYEFVIERIEKGLDDEDYYIVKDPFDNLHTIPVQYYNYYGFSIGSVFRGKIIRYKTNGERTIEPENPFYKKGDILELEVTGNKKNTVNQSFTIFLRDKFGFTHCIDTALLPESISVKCRVIMIRKGKPLLSLV